MKEWEENINNYQKNKQELRSNFPTIFWVTRGPQSQWAIPMVHNKAKQ